MSPDTEKYMPYIDHLDVPKALKVDLIHTVWKIMLGFAERGTQVDSTIANAGTRSPKDAIVDTNLLSSGNVENTRKTITTTFRRVAQNKD